MITVTMYLSAGEFCKGFTIKGHADSYVGDSQYDLVCAAVSAVTLTCALGLRDILGNFPSHIVTLRRVDRWIFIGILLFYFFITSA